ncbi:DUF6442 family protein [Acetobacterium bakii]|uniref:Uncharacterized protein n=1 Tax=Acetobacterium bakii TaxID=52689 RepID=A0A0L6TYD4_9FIRM|nr:DUF6442 family protein [Acetobacterium bakii]KNZ41258.1 hypothetical protein AKG39_13165 [Acetobacterium bakii]
MDRNEILTRNKDSKAKDEGLVYVEDKSRRYGEIGLSIMFILLVFYNFAKGLPIYDLLAIFWGYLGMSYVYKYRASKTKGNLVPAIAGLIAAVVFLLDYILQTW